MASKYLKISINIPLIKGGSAEKVLNSLKKVKYPKNMFEIVIVEGNQIAKQRNIALKNSSGNIAYLLDDDSQVKRNSLNIINNEFKNPKVAALGGPSLDRKSRPLKFENIVGYALETYFGAMRMKFRYSKQKGIQGSEYKLIGANLALRISAVQKIGEFNEKIVPNEETDLLRRLKLKGFILKYNNQLSIYRYHRKNAVDLYKQFKHYGTGRMKQILHIFMPEDVIFLLPILFIIFLFSFIFIPTHIYLSIFAIYLLLGFATSLKASIKYKKTNLFYLMIPTFFIIHVSYGIGLISELINYFFKIKPTYKKRFVSKITIVKGNKLSLFCNNHNL